MADQRVLLFGIPRIERDDRIVEVDTRKALALLAYLAVTRQRQSRDALAALLWPEYDTARARAALRRTLSALNAALDDSSLHVDRDSITLDPSTGLWIDVDRFRTSLAACATHDHAPQTTCDRCLPLLNEAANLYRADFLAGFTLRDSPAFDDWQIAEAEHLRHELAGALERLTDGYARQQQWERAIETARRWLALDPLHEPAHRALMQIYAWSRRRAAALRQYEICGRILRDELGESPDPRTVELYESIRRNSVPVPRDGDDSRVDRLAQRQLTPTAPPGTSEPLVGRERELATILNAYESIKGDGRLIVIEGEAGIGKTRLAGELIARLTRTSVLRARCYAGEARLAYGPFVELLAMAARTNHAWLESLDQHTRREIARLLPDLNDSQPSPLPPLHTPGAQIRFFAAISDALLAAARGARPGVLFLDDLHWADSASLDLLAFLARRLRDRPTCLLLTWRSEQVPADHRLRLLLAEADRAGTVTAVSLQRLSREAVIAFAQATTNTVLPPDFGPRLYLETEGLPLFMREYVAAATHGALESSPHNWPLPGGVRGLLLSRLTALSDTARPVLAAAAVVGRSFDFDTLRDAIDLDETAAIDGLEELVTRGLVAEQSTDGDTLRYDFNHDKLRALVYNEISLPRRRLLHRRIATALADRAEASRDRGVMAAQIASHFRHAGLTNEAARWFQLAGEHARALYANAEAVSHFAAALALGHPDATAIHESLGDLYTLLGEYGAALRSYDTAAHAAEAARRAAIERKRGNVHLRRGDWQQARLSLEAALRALPESQAAERAGVLADLSLAAHHSGDSERADALARESLRMAETARDDHALAQAHNILCIIAAGSGDSDAARQHGEQSLSHAEALGDPAMRAAALNNLALALEANGDLDGAIRRAGEALALCSTLGDRHREAALHNRLADLLHAAGRTVAAMTHLKQAVAIYAEIGVEAGAVQPAIWKLSEW